MVSVRGFLSFGRLIGRWKSGKWFEQLVWKWIQMFNWTKGRQGSGYEKFCICRLLFFDVYLLRFPEGSYIKNHTDPVPKGKHYRLNLVLRKCKTGGEFKCFPKTMINTSRIKFFRPDIQEHQVTTITEGSRLVLSIGWILHKWG